MTRPDKTSSVIAYRSDTSFLSPSQNDISLNAEAWMLSKPKNKGTKTMKTAAEVAIDIALQQNLLTHKELTEIIERFADEIRAEISEACRDGLFMLAGSGVCTPEEGYGHNTQWLLSDIKRAFSEKDLRIRILEERVTNAEITQPEIAKRLNDMTDELKLETMPLEDQIAKKDAEIERLEQQLIDRENLIVKHANHAGMNTSQNSWKGCNNWLVSWIEQKLTEATKPEEG